MRMIQIGHVIYNLDALESVSELNEEGERVEPTLSFWAPLPPPKSDAKRVEHIRNAVELVFGSGAKVRLNVDQAHIVRNMLMDRSEEVYNLDEFDR
jgi:hypothetical protein